LLLGQFAEGWEENEWRLKNPLAPQRPWPQPVWDGSPLAGRTIMLRCEQGLGDHLQFVRYAPLVKASGGTVMLACPRRMMAILGTCAGVDQLVADEGPLPPFDFQMPLLSLPRVFHTDLTNTPASVPYLRAPQERVSQWAKDLAPDGRLRIGIGWQGNRNYAGDRWRSIPLAQFAPLAAISGVRLIGLQKWDGSEQISQVDFAVEDLGSRLDNGEDAFLDTAAVIKNLDLVVTSDTALAHLAGALGAKTWLALPVSPDWRWMLEREDSPWYPTMRLFRQDQRGDWSQVFARMAAELANIARST
jgi:hypothetical protein